MQIVVVTRTPRGKGLRSKAAKRRKRMTKHMQLHHADTRSREVTQ